MKYNLRTLYVLGGAVSLPFALALHTLLLPPGGQGGEEFGLKIAIDGDTAVVGAPGLGLSLNPGSVFVYRRRHGMHDWQLEAKLQASDGGSANYFGDALALANDALVVGAPLDNAMGIQDAGAAYVLERQGASFVEVAKLAAPEPKANGWFGYAVATSPGVVAIGDPSISAVQIYRRQSNGWIHAQTLQSPGANDHFGLALAAVPKTLYVAASKADEEKGAVYAFDDAHGAFDLAAKLVASDGQTFDQLGVSIAASGHRVIAGAPSKDMLWTQRGAIYVFARDAQGNFFEEAILEPSAASIGANFGIACAIDGNHLVGGAWLDDSFGFGHGAAYIYRYSAGRWMPMLSLSPESLQTWDQFGASLALSDSSLLIGAPGDDDAGPGAGAVYAYTPSN